MKQKWAADKIERRKVSSLVPYARNSRTHSDAQIAQIAASIKEWGWTTPVLIDESGGIIAGHGRVMAAQKLGIDEIPCMIAEGWSEAQKRAYVIADNKLALNAEWDEDVLRVELEELHGLDFDLSLTGFDGDEIELLIPDVDGESKVDEESVPPTETHAVTAVGDIWTLGKHRLMCGSATNINDMELLCDGASVDMWLTDPPYNVAYTGGTKDALQIKNDSMPDNDFRQFLRDAYVTADCVMKPGAVFYIWHADLEGYNFRGAARDAGWAVRQCLIWKKSSLVLGRQDYQWMHEPCLYGWKGGGRTLMGFRQKANDNSVFRQANPKWRASNDEASCPF